MVRLKPAVILTRTHCFGQSFRAENAMQSLLRNSTLLTTNSWLGHQVTELAIVEGRQLFCELTQNEDLEFRNNANALLELIDSNTWACCT
jgi:hypothetical protein